MRMWHKNLIPLLTNQHLLGMHNELHKFKPSFLNKRSITGRIYPVVQIEPWRMKQAHEDCVREMKRRNMNHRSPYGSLPDLSYLPVDQKYAKVDIIENFYELDKRNALRI